MELIKCNDCIYKTNCPCGYSYCNAACLTIQKKIEKRDILMKITFTCKLTMSDEFDDSVVETVYPVDVIVNDLIKDLKEGLSEKGNVDISDYSVSVN